MDTAATYVSVMNYVGTSDCLINLLGTTLTSFRLHDFPHLSDQTPVYLYALRPGVTLQLLLTRLHTLARCYARPTFACTGGYHTVLFKTRYVYIIACSLRRKSVTH